MRAVRALATHAVVYSTVQSLNNIFNLEVDSVKCPFCGKDNTKVIDSRLMTAQ